MVEGEEQIEYFNCHKVGHSHNGCRSWDEKEIISNFMKKVSLDGSYSTRNYSINEDMVLRFRLQTCSNHMCGYKEWLFDLN